MFTIASTAGLNTTAPTAAAAVSVLTQHLHDLAPDGPVNWELTTPTGQVHRGHLNLYGLPDDGFVADTVAEVTAALQDQDPAGSPVGPAVPEALR